VGEALYFGVAIFVLGSLGGVLLEVAWVWLIDEPGTLEPRTGLLYLPFNPVYGAAAVVGSFVLAPLAESPIRVFLAGLVIFTVIEYLASLIMERTFGTVFWDYSDKALNLGGRVCLEFAVYWGFLGLALVYLIDPLLRAAIEVIPRPAGDLIVAGILVAVVAATIITLLGFSRLRSLIAGWSATQPTSRWDRIVDRLAPPDAIESTFPRMNLSVRYRRLRRGP
jgi:uncharacterized membrane protein